MTSGEILIKNLHNDLRLGYDLERDETVSKCRDVDCFIPKEKISENSSKRPSFLSHLIESVDAGTGERIVSHDSFVGNQFIFSWLKL